SRSSPGLIQRACRSSQSKCLQCGLPVIRVTIDPRGFTECVSRSYYKCVPYNRPLGACQTATPEEWSRPIVTRKTGTVERGHEKERVLQHMCAAFATPSIYRVHTTLIQDSTKTGKLIVARASWFQDFKPWRDGAT
ncbi:hypothetical protein N7523_005759, partial [Penicillium sp. IBT 18751x]